MSSTSSSQGVTTTVYDTTTTPPLSFYTVGKIEDAREDNAQTCLVYVNTSDDSIANIFVDTKRGVITLLKEMESRKDKGALPGTRVVYVQKSVKELNPYEVDIVDAVWDDFASRIIHEDDVPKTSSEEDIANRIFYAELEKSQSAEKRTRMIRSERDDRLFFLDKMACNPMRWEDEFDEDERDDMRRYRKELLNITKHPRFPWSVEFPPMPPVVRNEFQKP